MPPDEALALLPAPDLARWVRRMLLLSDGVLFNRDHLHLLHARLDFLWAYDRYEKRGRRILGEARLAKPTGSNAWQVAARTMQLTRWFEIVPDFVITLDAAWFARASDAERLALIEHELYHCAQRTTAYGAPRFARDGSALWTIRAHDVEEFVGVVRRYGAGAAHVTEMVEAANRGPTVAPAKIAQACGTCVR